MNGEKHTSFFRSFYKTEKIWPFFLFFIKNVGAQVGVPGVDCLDDMIKERSLIG